MQEKMIEDKFNAAVNVIRSLPKDGPYQPSHEMMLKFYGLYKQATEGPCKEPKPSFYAVIKGYKWRAWSSLGNMSKTQAMNTYVEELKKIVETMSYSEDVAAFIEALGPFYEYVALSNAKHSDSNHNITGKPPEKSSSDYQMDNFELFSLCNGKESPKLNGTRISDDSDPNEDYNVKPKLITGSDQMNGYTINNEENYSPKFNNEFTNGDNLMVNGILDSSISPPKPPVNEEQNASSQNGLNTSSLKKLTSDTESDEEYSEPAETPELLQQKQKQKVKREKILGKDERLESPIRSFYENMTNVEGNNSPVLEIVTCGGGDAADAGRIRLAQSYQFHQVSRDSHEYSESSPVQLPRSRGGNGGRRRRDSDDSRMGDRRASSVDVNYQLILILQKIHQDLEAVLVRLDSLETQALSQHQDICALCQRRLATSFSLSERTSWWPFPELSPRSTFFLLTWPLILHGAVKLLIFIRARRRTKKAY